MSIKINKFIDDLLPTQESGGRWAFSSKEGLKYTTSPTRRQNVKLERVLKEMNLKFQTFDRTEERVDFEKIKKLEEGITKRVEMYSGQHKGLYLLLSRIFYGKITDIEKDLLNTLAKIKSQTHPLTKSTLKIPALQPEDLNKTTNNLVEILKASAERQASIEKNKGVQQPEENKGEQNPLRSTKKEIFNETVEEQKKNELSDFLYKTQKTGTLKKSKVKLDHFFNNLMQ